MSSRIAHEISHAWFGLVLGAKDWTEEWLSEGFATFMEDRILAHAKQVCAVESSNPCSGHSAKQSKQLRDYLQI